jgi:hypothetical protein
MGKMRDFFVCLHVLVSSGTEAWTVRAPRHLQSKLFAEAPAKEWFPTKIQQQLGADDIIAVR